MVSISTWFHKQDKSYSLAGHSEYCYPVMMLHKLSFFTVSILVQSILFYFSTYPCLFLLFLIRTISQPLQVFFSVFSPMSIHGLMTLNIQSYGIDFTSFSSLSFLIWLIIGWKDQLSISTLKLFSFLFTMILTVSAVVLKTKVFDGYLYGVHYDNFHSKEQ